MDNRLYRLFLRGERSGPPTVLVQPRSLGEQLVENGEEILAQCLANVCRQEWMVAKVVAPPGGGHLLGEQPMTFPA